MNALDYIPATVAFAAAFIAIAGKPKWDPTRQGLRRLTATGYLALCLAVAAIATSFALTHRAQQAADLRRAQVEQITRVAHTEIRLALQDLSGWFDFIIRNFDSNTYVPGYQGPHPSDLIWPLNMLDDRDRAIIATPPLI